MTYAVYFVISISTTSDTFYIQLLMVDVSHPNFKWSIKQKWCDAVAEWYLAGQCQPTGNRHHRSFRGSRVNAPIRILDKMIIPHLVTEIGNNKPHILVLSHLFEKLVRKPASHAIVPLHLGLLKESSIFFWISSCVACISIIRSFFSQALHSKTFVTL